MGGAVGAFAEIEAAVEVILVTCVGDGGCLFVVDIDAFPAPTVICLELRILGNTLRELVLFGINS
jgi:hypothetical protein